MKLDITPLFRPGGSQEKIVQDFSEMIDFPEEIQAEFFPETPLSGILEVFRIEEDVFVLLKKAEMTGKVVCARCLEEANVSLQFRDSEQIFYSERPKQFGEEEFFIDHDRGIIDLTPFFEQEILIHIPDPFVHAKGECPPAALEKIAAAGRNTASSPFADLKKLLEEQKKK